MSSEVYRVVKKKLLPSLDPDSPLGQLADLQQSLTIDLKSKDVVAMEPLFKAKQLEIDYLTQQFEYLMDVGRNHIPNIVLNDLSSLEGDAEQVFINTTARNFLLGYVDSFLIQLKVIASQNSESIEDTKKRLTRDSSK